MRSHMVLLCRFKFRDPNSSGIVYSKLGEEKCSGKKC